MLITIENAQLRLTVDTKGAQLMSLIQNDTEYVWQGDSRYWANRAPNLFPLIGRLYNGTYTYQGKTFEMGIHGFARHAEFTVANQGADYVVLTLASSDETRASYPFDFTFAVAYRLENNTAHITYSVQNRSGQTMPFAVGGHPGFNAPFAPGEKFEDYYLEFTDACQPDRILFGPSVLVSGQTERYYPEEGHRIPLQHDLFDDDAIVLKHMCREITLRSVCSGKYLKVAYPDMPYLGLWHMPKTDAPYVCIEPWTSLPGREEAMEDLSHKSDLIHLEPGKTYENTMTVTIGED